MSVSGRSAPEFSAAISGAFHLVILPVKMPAILGRQVGLVAAGEVVGAGDRADDHRQVDRLAAGAVGVGLGLLVLLDGGVRAGPGDLLVDERLAARAGATGVVVHRDALAEVLERLGPLGHGVLLRAGPSPVERAGAEALVAGGGTRLVRVRGDTGRGGGRLSSGVVGGVVVGAARCQRERAGDGDDREAAEAVELHEM